MAGLVLTFDDVETPVHAQGLDPSQPSYVVRTGTVAFDSSYPTGGEALALLSLEVTSLDFFEADAVGGYVFEYDYSAHKLKAYKGNWSNASDGPLIEVSNAANLSAVAPRFLLVGQRTFV